MSPTAQTVLAILGTLVLLALVAWYLVRDHEKRVAASVTTEVEIKLYNSY